MLTPKAPPPPTPNPMMPFEFDERSGRNPLQGVRIRGRVLNFLSSAESRCTVACNQQYASTAFISPPFLASYYNIEIIMSIIQQQFALCSLYHIFDDHF